MNEITKAADQLAAFDSAASVQSANDMAEAFEAAGDRIARSLEAAAQRGTLSFDAMAEAVLNDLAKLAISEFVEAPLNALIDGIGTALGGAGRGGGSTTVNLNLSGASDPDAFRKSEGQIATALSRAVSLGNQRVG